PGTVSDDIEKMMNAIDEIDIGPSPRAKHHLRPFRPPPVPRVRCPVDDPVIGLDLDDPPRSPLPAKLGHEHLTQQLTRNRNHIRPVIKGVRKGLQWPFLLSLRHNYVGLSRSCS